MIADGREAALIPFMLRPFRCTDTRGRWAEPWKCVCVCVHLLHAHKWSLFTSLVGNPPCITLTVSVGGEGDQNASALYIPPLAIKARPLGHPLTCSVDLKKKNHLLMKFTFFKVYILLTVSAFPQIWQQLWKLWQLFVQKRLIPLNLSRNFFLDKLFLFFEGFALGFCCRKVWKGAEKQ